MGLAQIGVNLAFSAGGALMNLVRFTARTRRLMRVYKDFGAAAVASGVDVKEFGKIIRMETNLLRAQKGTTQFQRNIKLINQSVRTTIAVVRELRISATRMFRLFGGRPRTTAVKQIKRDLKAVQVVAKQTTGEMNNLLAVFGGTLAGIGGFELARNFGDFFKESVMASAGLESSKVTFDVLLGNAQKSEELMNRITKFSSATPFQRSDIIEGSKMLLNITKDNLDENEKLFKMAANIAALKPGSKVADVTRGIVGATVGEFDILKSSFGLVMRADDFKQYGQPGGKAYADAVLKAIEDKFSEKTGGRGDKLVGMLAATLQGKISTLVDNLDVLKETFGDAFIEIFDIKGVVDALTKFIGDFVRAFRFVMGKEAMSQNGLTEFLEIPTITRDLAEFVKGAMDKLRLVVEFIRDKMIAPLGTFFESAGAKMRKFLLMLGLGGVSILTGGGILIPMMTAFGIVVSGIIAVLTPFATAIIPAIKIGFASLLGIMPPVTGAIGAVALAFFLFRQDGESLFQTLKRAGDWFMWLGGIVKDAFVTFIGPFLAELLPQIQKNFAEVGKELVRLKEPIQEFFSFFTGRSVSSVSDFAQIGRELGWVLAQVIAYSADKAVKGIRKMADVLEYMRDNQFMSAMASDILKLGRSFFGIITGAERTKTSLKTFMLALVDIVTNPFRLILYKMVDMVQENINTIIPIVSRFNATLGQKLASTKDGLQGLKDSIREGFLATDLPPIEMTANIVADEKIAVNIDSEKVGDLQVKREMRARHSGRGGNPVNPGEMGFVLANGGSSIKTISLEEAAEVL